MLHYGSRRWVLCDMSNHGGLAGAGPFTPTPPPLPAENWPESAAPWALSAQTKNLLDLLKGEKIGFHLMCVLKILNFF